MTNSVAATLCDPRPSEHIVYSYTDDHDLLNAVTLFASAGLTKKEAVILVVTANHAEMIQQRLEQEGFRLAELHESGRLVFANAEQVLATFLVDGHMDEQKFKSGLGSLIDSARGSSGRTRPVRVFGEMVDLIWLSNPSVTLRLEQLGNDVIKSHSVTVLCAYSVGGTKPNSIAAPLLACHSQALFAVDHVSAYHCLKCESTDLVAIHTDAIADELVECRSCRRLHRVEHASDGTKRLVPV
jgi:hypothetical protein